MTRTERQNLAIEKWKQAGCKACIVASTGFGKTRIALSTIERALSKNPNMNVVVVVPTKVLKDQWEEKILDIQLEQNVSVLVMMTAAKKLFNCDFLVIDECHRVNSVYLSNIFKNCSPKLILGLTATYERLDGREKLILDKYCPVCDTITIKEATENGWMAPCKIYRVLLDVDLTEYNKSNQIFMQHFSFFDFDFNVAMNTCTNAVYQKKIAKAKGCDIKEVRGHAYAWMGALRNRKAFIANHPKKIEIAKHILDKRRDKKAITFNSTIEQCESYDEGYIVHSKLSKKKNQDIMEEFSKCGAGSVIHSAKSLLEGVDVPGLNLAIITGFNSSKTNRIQSIGRVVRFEPNKEAEIFILILKGTVEEKWEHKAGEQLSYIEINELELEDILNYNKIDNKNEREQEKVNEFRV